MNAFLLAALVAALAGYHQSATAGSSAPSIPAEGLQFDGTFWALDTANTETVDGAFTYSAPNLFINDALTSGLAVTYTAPDLFVEA